MKRMKKILALTLAVVMTMAMSVTVFASGDTGNDPTGYTITVDGSEKLNKDVTHTYEAYQIFKGTISDGKLIGIDWGTGVNGAALLTALQNDATYGDKFTACTTAENVAKVLQDEANDSALAQKFAALAAENKATVADSADTTNMKAELSVTEAGYYLVMDKEGTLVNKDDAYTRYILRVVEDVTVVPKSKYPSVDKQVADDDTDDNTPESNTTNKNRGVGGFYESADHDINESFQFKLVATIPADVDVPKYPKYLVKFEDTMSAGVTFERIDSVTVNTTDVTTYTSTATVNQEGGSWNLEIADIKKVLPEAELTGEITITVLYSAHLNEDAIISETSGTGVDTNKNTVDLVYSNNPNASATDTYEGKTPEDNVFVFTYKINNTKYFDEEKAENVLKDAEFQLLDSTGAEVALIWDEAKKAYRPIAEGETAETLKSKDDGKFPIIGVDAGTYTIHETKAPEGYNPAEDIAVSISAKHSENDDTVKANLELTASNTDNKIIDRSGATLPTTGGIGTTIFYVIGAILVVGAGVVLITRRRMSAQ